MNPQGIDVQDASKTFSRGISHDVQALHGVTLRVHPGRVTAVVGPSGCGKTTLLKLIGGLEQPTGGCVRVDGLPPDEARRRQHFTYGFQNPVLLPWLTILQNVQLLPKLARQPQRIPASDLLRVVGLAGFESRYPNELSGGMRQRASLARALSVAPRYVLLDEPFGALDDLTRETLDDVLAQTRSAVGFGCVLVTHNVTEAVYLADDVIVMSPRPGSIRQTLPVPFPHPRTAVLRRAPEFLARVRDVREALA
jgi:NitT/TauT family transport system ATP-binding protein